MVCIQSPYNYKFRDRSLFRAAELSMPFFLGNITIMGKLTPKMYNQMPYNRHKEGAN